MKARPLHGLGVVMLKELSDHLTSVRMRVLEWLVVLIALAALYGAIQQIKDTTAEDPFLFLRLFTTSREPLPSFVSFLALPGAADGDRARLRRASTASTTGARCRASWRSRSIATRCCSENSSPAW